MKCSLSFTSSGNADQHASDMYAACCVSTKGPTVANGFASARDCNLPLFGDGRSSAFRCVRRRYTVICHLVSVLVTEVMTVAEIAIAWEHR